MLAGGADGPQLVPGEEGRDPGQGREGGDRRELSAPGADDRAGARRVVARELVLGMAARFPGQLRVVLAQGAGDGGAAQARQRHGQAEPVELAARVGEPRPQGAGEARVVHGAVPAVAREIAGGVVAVLGDQPGVPAGHGGDLALGGADLPRHLVGEVHLSVAAGHVRHVDPPAVGEDGAGEVSADDAARPAGEPLAEHLAALVELGQGRYVEPAGVLLRVLVEEVEAGFGGVRIGLGGAEPFVGVAGVVRGQVQHESHPAAMERRGEPDQGLVPAQQRIHGVEGRGVVAVHRPRREHGGEIDGVRAEGGDVVQPVDHPVEVAAVELLPGDDSLHRGLVLPGHRDRPLREVLRSRTAVTIHRHRGAAGEAIGEDLVDDRIVHPARGGLLGDEPEVGRVGHVPGHQPGRGEPGIGGGGSARRGDGAVRGEHAEAIDHHGVDDPQRRLPPGAGRLPRGKGELRGADLPVGHRAQSEVGDRIGVRHPHPQQDLVPDPAGPDRDVERSAVVVGLLGQRHPGVVGADGTCGADGRCGADGPGGIRVARGRHGEGITPSRRRRWSRRRCSAGGTGTG